MAANPPDAVEFRDRQRESWNSAAGGWRKWSEVIDRGTGGISRRLVELAGAEPGSRVLDGAAGYGEAAVTPARAGGGDGTGGGAVVSGQPGAVGRERAAAAGGGHIDFPRGGAPSLG